MSEYGEHWIEHTKKRVKRKGEMDNNSKNFSRIPFFLFSTISIKDLRVKGLKKFWKNRKKNKERKIYQIFQGEANVITLTTKITKNFDDDKCF